MIRFFFLTLFILGSCVYRANSQDYVITIKGDSIAGKVKIEKIGVEKKIYVTSNDKKKSNYSIFQFRKAVIRGETFIPFKRGDQYDIVKIVQEGYLSLFAFQMENQNTYEGLYLAKKDGQSIEVPNIQFKKQISKLVDDCPEVKARVESREFKRTNLDQIVAAYNICIEKNTATVYATQYPSSGSLKNQSQWDELKQKIENSSLSEKENLLEMLEEIKSKKSKNEKIPKFLIDSFKQGIATDVEINKLFESLNQ